MKKNWTLLIILYRGILISLALYSFFLIDPNITFFNHPVWSRFLEFVLQIGYYQRSLSWQIYIVLIGLLTLFHLFFIQKYKEFNPIKIAFIISCILIFSYPFLSHDFLKYMFDAKILTQYHQNPYAMRPVDFSYDPWLRFMQWIEQPFRYGPIFLLIIIIPSFLSMGKFLLSFIFFKITFMVFYLLAVLILQKMNKRWAVIFATHPLLLIDGLVNGHNDLIGVSLFIAGIYMLQKKRIISRLILLASSGIKYLTLPTLFISLKDTFMMNKYIFLSFLILPFLLLNSFIGNIFLTEIHTWYFIVLLGFLPLYEGIITKLLPLFIGLLLAYYPFIRFGNWEHLYGIPVKHLIIVGFALANLILFLLIPKWRNELQLFFTKRGFIKI